MYIPGLKSGALSRYQAPEKPSQEPYRCWLCLDSPAGESSPNPFAPGGAPARLAPSAGVSRRMPPPVSATAGIPSFERPGGTSSRSLSVCATPPGMAGVASSELRP
ncbi:hypothetical protein NDU88_006857 [Pleurodeles waltl]|uniref:Uncharacterized protein n=1 Tax=Pleurodeles waltl TaxID=8319 RepID=A0AAV7NVP5_PLEWA|nr:hypothetical protein NDU88_006857 [Pleurodeles waltl]